MATTTLTTNAEAAKQWRFELSSINQSIRRIRDWGRTATRSDATFIHELSVQLQDLSRRLHAHFQHGNELYELLRQSLWCVEVESAQRQAAADQQHLLARLGAISTQLDQATPALDPAFDATFDTLETVQDRLEWFFDELDQHEEREADSFEWLLQTDC